MEDKHYVIARWIVGQNAPSFEDFNGTQNEAISYILTFDYGNETGQIREAHVCDAHGSILYSNKLMNR